MKIHSVKLKNFRSYADEFEISFDDMSIILGKNDIGKSTILEALDIFFTDGDGCVKIDIDDINKQTGSDIEISVIFRDFEDEILIDESITTKLSEEYLLNQDGLLEIKKIYTGKSLKASAYIVANHPTNNGLETILTSKIVDLRKRVEDEKITIEGDKRVASHIRKSIRNFYTSTLNLSTISIPLDKESAKDIREKIQPKLPVYTLFQSDRTNNDQDPTVQDPMNIALKNILSEPGIIEQLQSIYDIVTDKLQQVSDGTLTQLHRINPILASQLNSKVTSFDKLTWNKAFGKTEILSDSVPMNKRGSGVKRLLLLSYFLNEVERRKTEQGLGDIVYAFEEPETSQHPEHQEILINAFKALAQTDNVQVLLTTHSPYVYKGSVNDPYVKLIYIKGENGIKQQIDLKQNRGSFHRSPSWGEINYFVYGLSTFEFFDELYSHMEEINNTGSHVDNFFLQYGLQKDQIRKRIDRNGNQVEDNSTYITCLRHQIHHPNNHLNPIDYTVRLEEANNKMIDIIKLQNHSTT